MIDELGSAVEDVVKVQPIVKKLHGTMAKLSGQVKSKVPILQVVEPVTPTNNYMGTAKDQTMHAREMPDRL
jgi:hypothetical protein